MKQTITMDGSILPPPKRGWWGKFLRWFDLPRTAIRIGTDRVFIGRLRKDGSRRVYRTSWM